ncbi:MAG: hypothetical protein J6I40_03870 [Mailhella sp.]|nr:hypothetical protein [Mailhella sp.]
MTTIHPRSTPLLPAILSAAGIAFCSWVMMTGGDALCVTEGCSLFQDFRIAGYSLWEGGLVFFTLLLLLCLLRLSGVAALTAGAGLAADIILLSVMLFTAPCFNCLAAGALIALCYLALLHEAKSSRTGKTGHSLLAAAWTVLFLFNVGGIIRDASVPWTPVTHDGSGDVQVWFSPSCPACQKLVLQYENIPGAAWYPVAEDAADLWVIKSMADELAKGVPLPEAAARAREAVPRPFVETPSNRMAMLRPGMLLLQLRLWINRAHVLSAGSSRLPFVEFKGLPAFLMPADPAAQEKQDAQDEHTRTELGGTHHPEQNGQTIPELPGLGVAGFCDGESPEPCQDDARPSAPSIDTSGMF